jgi:ABC-type Fe3+ transport system substrate-binding protein
MERKTHSYSGKALCAMVIIGLMVVLSPFSKALSFDQRTIELIEGAKKEGKFAYGGNQLGTEEAAVMTEAFKKHYGLEGLDVQYFRLNSDDLVRRTEEEIKAGKLTTDVVIHQVVEWSFDLARRGELMRYVSPEYQYYGPAEKLGMNYLGYWVADGTIYSILYNPKFVKKDIQSWYDLLDPRYKEGICMGNVEQSASYTLNYLALRKVLPKEFFEKLAALKPQFAVGGENLANKVVTGEFPIAINVTQRILLKYAMKEVRLKMAYPKEGVITLPLIQMIMARSKHPSVSKLWIDWVRSKPGLELLAKTTADIPGREGMSRIPQGVKPELAGAYPPRIEDLNIIPMPWKDVTPEDTKKARQEWISIFAK